MMKLDRKSYLIGILMGICVGVGIGYLSAILMGFHRFGVNKKLEVAVGVGVLQKLQTNDIAGAQHCLQWIVAEDYIYELECRHGDWLCRAVFYDPEVVQRVEQASKQLPGLAQAIEERRKSKP